MDDENTFDRNKVMAGLLRACEKETGTIHQA